MRSGLVLAAAACIVIALPGAGQPPTSVRVYGSAAFPDMLRMPPDTRVGMTKASPERIAKLIDDLGAGSGFYGSCTPRMSKGDVAAVELVKVGRPAVDSLIGAVQDISGAKADTTEQANRRWFSVQILGRIGDLRAVPALEFCLRREPVAYVRAFAPAALERLNDPRSEQTLLMGLKDPFPDIQANCAHALGALHSTRAIPDLIALLGEPPRRPAFSTGGMVGLAPTSPAPAAASALAEIGAPAVAPLRLALTSREPQVRRFAALGLALNRSRAADSDARILLRDADADIRLAAARSETARRDSLAVPALTAALHDPSPEVAAAAGRALAEAGGLPGIRALIATANGADGGGASAAAEALRDIWNPKAADLLLDEVSHGKGRARASAAESLLHFSDPRSASATLGLLEDADPDVRYTAVWLINQLKDKRAFPALVKAMDDPVERVRSMATECMSRRTSDPIAAPLLRKLEDSSELVRLYAIYGLTARGDRSAIPALQALVSNGAPRVQEAARKAIEAIEAR